MRIERLPQYYKIAIGSFVIRLGNSHPSRKQKIWYTKNGSGFRWWLHIFAVDIMY